MHNVFLFLVDCLLQQRTTSKQYKIPTKSSTPVGLSDPAVLMSFQTEIEVSQLPALSQHSCKPLCPLSSEIIIVTQIKVHQRCHYVSTPASLSVSCPFISKRGSSSVVMRHRTVTTTSCLFTNFIFSSAVSLRTSSQKLLLKRTTADRHILSTTSFNLFDVLLSMIVLTATRVLQVIRWNVCLEHRICTASSS